MRNEGVKQRPTWRTTTAAAITGLAVTRRRAWPSTFRCS